MSGPVKSGPFGGDGGTPWQLFPHKSGLTLKSIQAWEGTYDSYYVVRGIQLTWCDNSTAMAGNDDGVSKSYDFQVGEQITMMTIRAKGYVDNILFTTDQGGIFEIGGDGGDSNEVAVGNGQLAGFDGDGGGAINSISVYFRN